MTIKIFDSENNEIFSLVVKEEQGLNLPLKIIELLNAPSNTNGTGAV